MINSFHCFFERKIHYQNNKCNDCRCNCNDDSTALQFAPTWPAYFMKKLIGSFINIGLEFTHIRFMLFVGIIQQVLQNWYWQLLFQICTGGEIRTPIKGFGDLYSTLELHLFIILQRAYSTSKTPVEHHPPISRKQQAMFSTAHCYTKCVLFTIL